MNVKEELLQVITSTIELEKCLENIHLDFSNLFRECCNYLLNTKPYTSLQECSIDIKKRDELSLKLNYVEQYVHDLLNMKKWSDVPIIQRQSYTAVSFLKAVRLINNAEVDDLKSSLASIDKGFLLGLPLSINKNLLPDSAKILNKYISDHSDVTNCLPVSLLPCVLHNSNLDNVKGDYMETLSQPSIEMFYKRFYKPEQPVKLENCITHWPAMKKWPDLNYLIQIAGERTVPIEIGTSYSAEDFSQKLMKIRDFIRDFLVNVNEEVGYLAQHDLFNQIPELRDDILIPEYCCTRRDDDVCDDEPEICVWFGPKNTVSTLHQDPKDNLLCQIFGIKQVVLYSPENSDYLYPHSEFLLTNTAQVDPLNPNLAEFPDFVKAEAVKCLLKPGDILYIPPKWWHHVTALEQSFSVNFWW